MAGYLLQRRKIIEELYENETRIYKTDYKFLVASINVWYTYNVVNLSIYTQYFVSF